ncbi:lysosome-associated membrane glycoprotein 1-like [Plodia interpunctella]|uniref:lysosome-associated membrane glycoprotein 1-like n=1 Tax=Plodia interpunctella TaxID=58824 RepID=UPI0023688224|nr:lysosome-associated membrane glycoprotein 1-like [Plodia interpunctella]
MASVKFLTLLAVMCTCYGLGHGEAITTQKPVTIDIPRRPVESLPVAPVHLETSVPQVVAAEDLSTVVKPKTTTTTSPPTSTTPSTTTTPPTTPTTTTPPPTTSTTTSTTTAPPAPPAPTPAPSPKPIDPPQQGTWSYTDKNNITCVVVQFAAQLNISYFQVNNSQTESHAIFNFPSNATVTNGSCNKTEQWIELSWPATDNITNQVVLVFDANTTSHDYEMKAVNITLSPAMLVNASTTTAIVLWHGRGWQLPMATSYRCTPATYLKMTSGDNTNIGAVVTVTRLQEEAFRTTTARGFSAARECGGGDVPDAVPIAVGCALAGLVVVVVVAYLVARRRSAVRGYLSM